MRSIEINSEWRWNEKEQVFDRHRRSIDRELWPVRDRVMGKGVLRESEHDKGLKEYVRRYKDVVEAAGSKVVGERGELRINRIFNRDLAALRKHLGRAENHEERWEVARSHGLPIRDNGSVHIVDMQLLVEKRDGGMDIRNLEYVSRHYRSVDSGCINGSDPTGRRVKNGPDTITGIVGYDAQGRKARHG